MTVPIDGGWPAFPCEAEGFMNQDASGNIVAVTEMLKAHKGMTLRDYFAGQALAGICATYFNLIQPESIGKSSHESIATASLSLADAMLKARKEKR